MMDPVQLWERVAVLPPGPELAVVLAGLTWGEIPNAHIGDVVAARARQRAHGDAEMSVGMVHLARSTPLDELGDAVVGRAETSYPWVSSEIAALLTLTPTAADRELGLAEQLHDHLPLVLAAFRAGRIDRNKAWMFCEYSIPPTCLPHRSPPPANDSYPALPAGPPDSSRTGCGAPSSPSTPNTSAASISVRDRGADHRRADRRHRTGP
ncbi:DUF222 domain-containing protein [Pseudonocardia sp. GCM10023141]|uniref:DUF222 domain-containing protein n=1 Tax=Pseudonocardia sp. GCM10023141 TaxID=3252653 RepID=UPI0036090F0F